MSSSISLLLSIQFVVPFTMDSMLRFMRYVMRLYFLHCVLNVTQCPKGARSRHFAAINSNILFYHFSQLDAIG